MGIEERRGSPAWLPFRLRAEKLVEIRKYIYFGTDNII